jgi:hypothetical protein
MDDTAVLIRCQQGREGGVVAGHHYVLGYVRDQYGVSRGLLALGQLEAARAILEFYWDTWQRHGAIHNAQGIGVPGLFHVHENDDVEITAYLILQAFDYQAAAGDDGLTRRILPMLEWAFEAQRRHLAGGMLPFNGDETYIAGGILPREVLLDGSAEATLLFAESGRRLAAWARGAGAWPAGRLDVAAEAIGDAERSYRRNFQDGGRWWANQPERRGLAEAPRFRHGVCLGRLEGCAFFGWTRRGEDGRYYCPACYPRRGGARAGLPPAQRYALPSIALMASYVDSALMSAADIDATLADALAALEGGGSLAAQAAADRLPGYELGSLLHALAGRGHPASGRIARRLLSLRDATGAWVEYYENDAPQGTRCRPWESGVNVEALARWARRDIHLPEQAAQRTIGTSESGG